MINTSSLLIPSSTNNSTLQTVLERLARHEAIDAVLLLGSTATSVFTSHSDYDLVIVARGIPTNVFSAYTTIDRHITDVFFLTTSSVDTLIAKKDVIDANVFEGKLLG